MKQEIQYNLLNLPSSINYQSGNMASYVYSASGAKLSVTYTNGATTTNNQYCGNMLYEDGTLKQILIDCGYITFSGTTPQYHFYLQDHLGNNRVVVSAGGTVEQVNHYYPYGGLMSESTNGDLQRFKYNGKELDRMHGLDWYDYGARHFDAARVSWPTMDPLAEKYYDVSPYVYCGNNPVRRIDPTGMIWEDPKEAEELVKNINRRISQLESKNQKIQSKIDSGKYSEKKLKKFSSQKQENSEMISNLRQSVNDIDKLGKDANTYAFRHKDGGAHHVVKEKGIVYIETSSDALSIHEITHVRQSLDNGGLQFSSNNQLNNIGNNIKGEKGFEIRANAEVEAYQMQYSYDPSSYVGQATSLNGIDAASVGNITNERGERVYNFINVWIKFVNQRNKIIGR